MIRLSIIESEIKMAVLEAKIKNIKKYQYDGITIIARNVISRAGAFLAVAELTPAKSSPIKEQKVYLLKRYLVWSGLNVGDAIRLNYGEEPRQRKFLEFNRGEHFLLITDKNLSDHISLDKRGSLISAAEINVSKAWTKADIIFGVAATLAIIFTAIYIFWVI